MGVEDVGAKGVDGRVDPPGERGEAADLAQHATLSRRLGAIKGQAIDRFDRVRRNAVARAGDGGDLPAARLLRLQDRARAEGVAALQGQSVVEDMENPHGPSPCTRSA